MNISPTGVLTGFSLLRGRLMTSGSQAVPPVQPSPGMDRFGRPFAGQARSKKERPKGSTEQNQPPSQHTLDVLV